MPIRRRLCVYTTLIGDYEYLNDQPLSKNTVIKFAYLADNGPGIPTSVIDGVLDCEGLGD
jgi:hypothetical protein